MESPSVSRVRSELVAVVENHKRIEEEKAEAKTRIAYLKDVHLALVLDRVRSPALLHTLFDIVPYVSDKGILNIAIRGQRLGSGWTGKATMTSETTGKIAMLDALAETVEPNGSLFKFQLPSLLDEWTLVFSLSFDPQYKVPEFVPLPVLKRVDTVHIDVLDLLQPCPLDTDTFVPQYRLGMKKEIPHLCELWIRPQSMTVSELSDLAPKLLLSLLFEKTSPLNAHQTISAVMISPTFAMFCIPGEHGKVGYVNMMCICEDDKLALRVSSTGREVYLGVLIAVIKRLCLLLDLDLGDDLNRTSHDLLAALSMRSRDLARLISSSNSNSNSKCDRNKSNSNDKDETLSDFLVIECKSQITLFQ